VMGRLRSSRSRSERSPVGRWLNRHGFDAASL
jgi:hypothetical protein